MDETIKLLNELLVDTFNDILIIEQNAFGGTRFSNLSVTEVHTIDAIGDKEPRTMSEVAADLKITVGTLTTAVNKLIRKGYVERKRIEEDRRVVLIQLTHEGKVVYRLHKKFHHDMVRSTIEGLETEEELILIKSLKKMNGFFKLKYNFENMDEKE